MAISGIKLFGDIIIPACGPRKAGTVVSKEDCGDSWQWMLANKCGKPVDESEMAAAVAEAVAAPEPEVASEEPSVPAAESVESEGAESQEATGEAPEEPVAQTEDQVRAAEAIKLLLKEGKMRLETIVSQSGLAEEVVKSVLTEANGFRKNQQAWWGLI